MRQKKSMGLKPPAPRRGDIWFADLGVKNGQVFYPLRVAVSGKQFTPGGGVELSAILGKERTIERVKIAIEKL